MTGNHVLKIKLQKAKHHGPSHASQTLEQLDTRHGLRKCVNTHLEKRHLHSGTLRMKTSEGHVAHSSLCCPLPAVWTVLCTRPYTVLLFCFQGVYSLKTTGTQDMTAASEQLSNLSWPFALHARQCKVKEKHLKIRTLLERMEGSSEVMNSCYLTSRCTQRLVLPAWPGCFDGNYHTGPFDLKMSKTKPWPVICTLLNVV